jgi:hypothetical protein
VVTMSCLPTVLRDRGESAAFHDAIRAAFDLV